MLQILQQEQLTELLPLLREFSQHASQKCRVVMYDILIWIYNNTWYATHYFLVDSIVLYCIYFISTSSTDDVSLKAVTSDVRDQLLQGLSDDAENIR